MKYTITLSLVIFSFATMSAEEIPHEVIKLQQDRNVKIQKIDEIYYQELEKIRDSHMKKGDLESANLVENLIRKKFFSLKSEWRYRFTGKNGTKIRIFQNGKMIEDGVEHPITFKKDSIIIHFEKRGWEELKVDYKDLSTISGMNSNKQKCSYTRLL